jgi:hypothetical protein
MDADLDALAELSRAFFAKCVPNEERWCAQQHADREAWAKAGKLGLLCTRIADHSCQGRRRLHYQRLKDVYLQRVPG